MQCSDKIFITGGGGMLGTHLIKVLKENGYTNILAPTREELELLDKSAIDRYIEQYKPEYVFHLAGFVHGLLGNMRNQIDALYVNATINLNVLRSLHGSSVKKVFIAGTVASYPYPYESLPLQEDMLYKGLPHYGEFGYGLAKNIGYHLGMLLEKEGNVECVTGLFTNLFGEYDTYDVKFGHVIPSLICKIAKAKEEGSTFEIWGDGSATRDFLYAKDAAKAALLAMEKGNGLINISSNTEITIKELVDTLCDVAGFTGEISWKIDAPTGIERRVVDNSKLQELGFTNFTDFAEALEKSLKWYEEHYK